MRNFYSGDFEKKKIWFRKTKGGNQSLVREDGSYRTMKERDVYFKDFGPQALSGWQRSILLMKEYRIWDATAFGCCMSCIITFTIKRRGRGSYALLFASPEGAERSLYPYLPADIVEKCRENVEAFYADPQLQKKWNSIILHPVCLKVRKGKEGFEPMPMAEIGENEEILEGIWWKCLGGLGEERDLQEFLFR